MDINQVTIFGRLGRDPELRQTEGGDPLCNFSIANSTFKQDSSQESGWKEDTHWFDVTAWGYTAEKVGERAKKGHRVIVNGSLKQRTWEDDEGKKHEKVSITARQVQFLEKLPKKDPDAEPVEKEPAKDVAW